ncbi:MAG: VOC family protein [Anaerolineaceae bacterium]
MTDDVEGLVEFLKHVFGAAGELQAGRPTEVTIGGSIVMVSSGEERDPMPAFLYVYVNDVDTTYQLALEAGASSLEEPRGVPYGDRRGMVGDPWGNIWQIATRQ